MDAHYLTSAEYVDQLPDHFVDLEVAIMGRSNCGKSSLINRLTMHAGLAKSSATPGRTRMANFFSFAKSKEQTLIIVDLPGFGFAKAPNRQRQGWEPLILACLERPHLMHILWLSDMRRTLDEQELRFLSHLHKQKYNISLVLTKEDKISKSLRLSLYKKNQQVLSRAEIDLCAIFTTNSRQETLQIVQLRNFLFDCRAQFLHP